MNFQPVISKYSKKKIEDIDFLVICFSFPCSFSVFDDYMDKAECQTLRSRLMQNRASSKVEWYLVFHFKKRVFFT